MLSSLINYGTGKRKVFTRLRNTSANRLDNPPSPKSFASPELLDISTNYPQPFCVPDLPHNPTSPLQSPILIEHQTPQPLQEPDEAESSDEDVTQRATTITPRVQLEIDTGPLEWFPPDLLNSDAFNFNVAEASGKKGGEAVKETRTGASTQSSTGKHGHTPRNPSQNGIDTGQEIAGEDWQASRLPPSSFKKQLNTTIEIPDTALRGRHTRSSTMASHAESTLSSSVSGTTLARALIGNSFVLSNDHRFSRHRPGLTRQDSTTLPRHSHSPHRRDRRNSGGDTTPVPFSDFIPPVPPVPANLATFTRKRRSSAPDVPVIVPELKQQHSASSIRSLAASYAQDSPIQRSSDVQQQEKLDAQSDHQVSHTQDAPSSLPSAIESQPPNNSTSTRTDLSKASGSHTPVKSASRLRAFLHHRTLSDPNSTRFSTTATLGADSVADGEYISPAMPSSGAASDASFSLSPYVGEGTGKRDSRRRQMSGVPGSPTTIRGKVDWILPSASIGSESNNRPRTVSRLPIGGERPRSLVQSETTTHPPENLPPTSQPPATSTAPALVPNRRPPANGVLSRSGVFNRQRSGSTPNPIMVTRDSKDFNTYNITVATAATGTSPASPEYTASQTFPETPNAFSPIYSALSFASPLRTDPNELLVLGNPQDITRSMTFSVGTSSLTQQVLLTRAATTVRGTRAGLPTRSRHVPSSHPYARNLSVLLTPPPEEPSDGDFSASPMNEEGAKAPVDPLPVASSSGHGELSINERDSASHSGLATPNSRSSTPNEGVLPENSRSRSPSIQADRPNNKTTPGSSKPPSMNGRTLTGNKSVDTLSLDTSFDKPLPPMPPMSPKAARLSDYHPTSPRQLPQPNIPGSSLEAIVTRLPPSTPPRLSRSSLSPQTSPRTPRALPQPQLPSTLAQAPATTQPDSPTRTRVRRFPPTPQSSSFLNPRHPSSTLTLSLGEPPPYYSIVSGNEHAVQFPGNEQKTASSSSNSDSSGPKASSSYTISPPANASHSAAGSLGSVVSPEVSSRSQRSGRRPGGPREPVRNPGSLPLALNSLWDHNSSASSSSSGFSRMPSANASFSAPKFQTPPVKWRGYTMDAAKWTFTSAQLQGIVSRAIRQSAEASSIRLLQLDTLDNDIPDEMHRLEMLRTDVKSRYKMLTRKRWSLLAALSGHFEGTEVGDSSAAARIVEEVADISATLDHFAEELHSVDEQIAQIKSLRDIHSASALAMALRKLNTSFLKQLSDTQALRAQVEAVEAERDEAWKEAEELANDFDYLIANVKVLDTLAPNNPGSTRGSSRRSSRVSASRKSSIRVSKAGLRPSRSQRSSVSSIMGLNSVLSSPGVKSSFHLDGIPPVPRIPSQKPLGIVTADLQSRTSTGFSTGSPSPDTKAMVKAQDELYAMLGITPLDSGTLHLRRPRSLSGAGEPEPSPMAPPLSRPLSDSSSYPRSGRRSSFPGSVKSGSLLADDRQAILATLGLMSG